MTHQLTITVGLLALLSSACAGQVTGTLGRQLTQADLRGDQVVYRVTTSSSHGSTMIELQSDGIRHRLLVSTRRWGEGWFGLWGDTLESRELNASCWSMVDAAVTRAALWSATTLGPTAAEDSRLGQYTDVFPTTVEAARGATYRRFEFEPLLSPDDDEPHSGDRFVDEVYDIAAAPEGPCRHASD